jgi:uncharacterized membrane protein YbjE (DUF340 family)
VRMVLARDGRLIAAAIATGAVATALVTRATFAELVAIAAANPWLSLGGVLFCGAVAATAAAVACLRIVRLDPWAVLRGASRI